MNGPDAAAARHRAAVLIDAKRPADAIGVLAPVVAANPGDAEALRLQSLALSNADRHQDAVAHAASAVALQPGSAASLCALSIAWLGFGDVRQALAAAEEACRCAPHDPHAHVARAEALLALRRRGEEARAAAWDALRLDPALALAYDVAGRAELACRNPAAAARAFREALRLSPDEAVFLNNLGAALMNSGNYTPAAGLFVASVRSDPVDNIARDNAFGIFWKVGFISLGASSIIGGSISGALSDNGYGPVFTTAVHVACVVAGLTVGFFSVPRAARGPVLSAARLAFPARRVLRALAVLAAYGGALALLARAGWNGVATAIAIQVGILGAFAVLVSWFPRRPKGGAFPASLGYRFMGVIDVGLPAFVGLMSTVAYQPGSGTQVVERVSMIVATVLYLAYVDGVLGGSPLRGPVLSRVVRAGTAERPGFARGLVRAVVKVVTLPLWIVSAVLVDRTASRRALHDLVAGTAVVRSGR